MYRKLLFACLLLAVVAELLEAKNAFYKRNVQKNPVRRHFQLNKRQSVECNSDQFLCANSSRCIPSRWICDGDNDCGDKSDEPEDCPTRDCPEGFVKCSNGQCIEKSSFCAGSTRCSNREATVVTEVECPRAECEANQFACPSITKCISRSWVCDTDNDCSDNSDETNCDENVCNDDEFRCSNGQCVDKSSYCTSSWSSSPCRVGTDVTGICLDFTCPEGNFKCQSDGKCLSSSSRCDGYVNCADGSDESESICPPVQCETGYAKCPTRNKCINARYFCDTDNDCGDNSDESPELCAEQRCGEDEVRCANGQCLKKEGFCREDYSCRDGSRTSNDLSICEPVQCDSGYTRCPTRNKCINSRYFCDNDNDCGDNSDEAPELCNNRECQENEIACASGQCVGIEGFCREEFSCRDSSRSSNDPTLCKPIECESGYGKCPNRNKCIRSNYFCDTDNDCGDNSDEAPELCSNRVCEENEISCANGQCIDITNFCSGSSSCRDSSRSNENDSACRNFVTQPAHDMSGYHVQYQCMTSVLATCGDRISSLGQQFDGLHDRDVYAKIAEIDLRSEICSPLETWRDCVLPILESNEQCQTWERLRPEVKQEREFAMKAFEYVCGHNVEVINREKGCLLKLNEQDQPVLMFKFMMSCASEIMGQRQSETQFVRPYCISQELQQCGKNVLAEECGDDIATVVDGLAEMARDFCKELNPPEQSTIPPIVERHARGIALLRKMLKSVF